MTPLVVRMMTVSHASSCGMPINQMTLEMSLMLLENIYVQASLLTIVIYECHIFIAQVTGRTKTCHCVTFW